MCETSKTSAPEQPDFEAGVALIKLSFQPAFVICHVRRQISGVLANQESRLYKLAYD